MGGMDMAGKEGMVVMEGMAVEDTVAEDTVAVVIDLLTEVQ